ncbi:MAG: GNAT family N-acetyltransferase [Thermoleophilia bacterium]|nr:GNAT family N-acetyltransferase [Thermoleophilia bacterium]
MEIRRATPADVDFLVELYTHEEVEPFLAASRAKDRESVLAELARDPQDAGTFVIEVGGERAGTLSFETANRRSRIASLGAIAVHPDFRGRRLADEASRLFQRHLIRDLGFHRLQLEIYGFNDRAIAHAERAGFVREGVRRRAYLRHGEWVDGVLFGLLAEEVKN